MSSPSWFVLPLHVDRPGLFIWDAKSRMVADMGGEDGTFRPRGWGRFQYAGGHKEMDEWEEWAMSHCAGMTDIHAACRKLNEEGAK